ncbi:cytochrome P450 [Hyphomicrobium nitrativorans NL23]|uniref:Cytochrome P450 n=2 Tax=Hyphomicrobium TaxID=81 RepID=V5SB36_9HYPH|nr:cytochrome P450 [Hyphomicrobium nitrativorans NL23]
MKEPPRDPFPDSTVALAWEGYRFASNRLRRFGTDAFSCRLMMKKAVCIGGPAAAALFYDSGSVERKDVAPGRIEKTLLGQGGIHGLDGLAHRHRKEMYLELMGPQSLSSFTPILVRTWREAAASWQPGTRLNLFSEAQTVLFRTMCEWAGIPLGPRETQQRAADAAAMVDAFGGIAWRNWKGRFARRRSERWMHGIVSATRDRTSAPSPTSALARIANFRDVDGNLLPAEVTAVELLNVIRPALAIPYFLDLAALKLSEISEMRDQVASNDEMLDCFVQELRRFCPFTPFLGARSRREIAWQGFRIPSDTLVVLDVYGIHRDERVWQNAAAFAPLRFQGVGDYRFSLLQQGGGDHLSGHRCAGEWFTIEALKFFSRELARMPYAVIPASSSFSLTRIPSRLIPPVALRLG